jgi:hypothetical protein
MRAMPSRWPRMRMAQANQTVWLPQFPTPRLFPQHTRHIEACLLTQGITSGPSKDYIRTLESKLRQSEDILLRLLPLVSDEQLSAALADTTFPSTTPVNTTFDSAGNPTLAHGDREHSPLGQLRSPEELRSWYRQRRSRDAAPHDQANSSAPHAGGHQRSHSYSDNEAAHTAEEEQMSVELPPTAPQAYMPYTTGMGTMSITAYLPNAYASMTPAFGTQLSPHESNTRALNASESLLLSPSFQEEFIW